MEIEWVYYAFAKDILNEEMFVCLFPGYTRATEGDRVVALGDDGSTRIGDIVYKDLDRPDDKLFNAVIKFLVNDKPLKAVSFWELNTVEWPAEEEVEDAVS